MSHALRRARQPVVERRRARHATLASGMLAVLCAAASGLPVARAGRPPEAVPVHILAPRSVDPEIVHADANNLVYLPQSPSGAAGLLVFIGGAPGPVASFTPFVSEAVRLGWRVIALDYSYNPPGTQLCEGRPGGDCFVRYRTAKVFGGEVPGLRVPPAEAIVTRLDRLLRFLAAGFPAERWDAYRDAAGPRWSAIAVTGFSQGSGLAAYLAKRVPVRRVVLLSSPWDHYDPTGQLAGWLAQPSATPPERWWGLYAAREPDAAWLGRAYAALGLGNSHVFALDGAPQR